MTPEGDRTTRRLLLVDRPYVSDHLRRLIARRSLPLVLTDAARAMGFADAAHTLRPAEAVARAEEADRLLVYTSSENALPWITEHLPFTPLAGLAATFKDKVRFREALRPLHPGFFFRRVAAGELDRLPVGTLPLPFVLKPAAGFFSLGVHTVSRPSEWPAVRRALRAGVQAARSQYPAEVLDTSSFIIEEWVPGEEYAVDAYFDAEGRPVVLGIWAHAFASSADTSDRVYTTSGRIVADRLGEVTDWLTALGRLTGARDLPVHVELRRDGGRIVPIEVNPLRFGGWCTTGDLARHAYGFDPYLHFLDQRRPDWPRILEESGDARFSVVVLDNSTGIDGPDIEDFDYDAVRALFTRPIELRRVDYRRYSVFGFLFVETRPGEEAELDRILRSDLSGFVRVRSDATPAARSVPPAPRSR